jgi:hypothetical protein
MDIIEAWEDMERLHPLLTGIVEGTLNVDEFKRAIRELSVWSWHTADHLNSLHKALEDD